MAKAVAHSSYEKGGDLMKELNNLSVFLGIGALAMLGLKRLWNDQEISREEFQKLVLDSGLGKGFEDRAWEVWKLGRDSRLEDAKRLYKAEAMLEQCDELAHISQGLKALGKMTKDPSVPAMVKRSITVHWFNKLFDFCGIDVPITPGDFTVDMQSVATPSEREAGLRRELSLVRKSSAFWEREARRLGENQAKRIRAEFEMEASHGNQHAP